MAYRQEEFLQLSGLQHFAFCRRQWALIHIENQWADNYLTVDGTLLHEKAHDSGSRETRGDKITARGMYIFSARLGLSGQCDVVEFIRDEAGIELADREGKWTPFPVEDKRGKPNPYCADELQLCAQAMCLEDMLCCDISKGALFYGEPRRRTEVSFTPELRERVKSCLNEMHELMRKGYTPKVRRKRECKSCSMLRLCEPELLSRSVEEYLRAHMEEDK